MNVKSEKLYRRNGYDTGSINEVPKVLPSDFNFGSSKEKADLGCEICLCTEVAMGMIQEMDTKFLCRTNE